MAFERSEELALGLFNRGAIKYADSEDTFWKLKSERMSPVYVNVRGITSFSHSLPVSIAEQKSTRDLAVEAYSEMLDGANEYDHILGIPHALTGLSGLVAQLRGESLITMRTGDKSSYGAHKPIEGDYSAGDVVVALDDVVTDGTTKLEVVEAIRAEGLGLSEMDVLVDREEGGRENLVKAGLSMESATVLGAITIFLHRNHDIRDQQLYWMEAYYQDLVDDGVIPAIPSSLYD